jgi:hypothetical protein
MKPAPPVTKRVCMLDSVKAESEDRPPCQFPGGLEPFYGIALADDDTASLGVRSDLPRAALLEPLSFSTAPFSLTIRWVASSKPP